MNLIKNAKVVSTYISDQLPMANRTAPWHPISTTVTNWSVPHSAPIEYKFNQYGYRDCDWSSADLSSSIWCFGDSQTVGMGVDCQFIWPTVLNQLSSIKTLNFGIAGASNDTITRVIANAVTLHKPIAICCLLSAPNRREIINKDYEITLFPKSLDMLSNISQRAFKLYLDMVDPVADNINYDKNNLLIKYICQANNIPLILIDFGIPISEITKTDVAHDNLHIGPNTHKMIADFCSINLKNSV